MALEVGLCGVMLVGMGLGSISIYWARGSDKPSQNSWGRSLFLVTLLVLGVAACPAAYYETRILTSLGLCLVLLVVAMLWETPGATSNSGEVNLS